MIPSFAPPPVGIGLVTFNRADRLPATIESLLQQSFGDFELVISDDCSSDNTEEVCRHYAARDARIRYRRNERNLNMPGNLNASLQAVRGKYLANLHDGDVYHKDLIARWTEALDAHPSAGFAFNAYRVVYDGSDGKGKRNVVFREDYGPLIPGRKLGARLLSGWSSCVFGTVMARREAYDRLGWFDPRFGNYSDVDMWMRIAREYDVAYVSEPLMDLMPGDPTRFYAFVHWKVMFWILGMHTANLARYKPLLPELAADLERAFATRRLKYLGLNMLFCLKRRRWDRVREGLALWRHCDDPRLRAVGRLLGRRRDLPDWYTPDFWRMARLQK